MSKTTTNNKNKATTLSYFIKRLKDSGYVTWKICNNYALADSRKWTVLVDPGSTSVYITCYESKDFDKEMLFEFSDGGQYFPKNYSIRTSSMEVIMSILVDRGIPQRPPVENESEEVSS